MSIPRIVHPGCIPAFLYRGKYGWLFIKEQQDNHPTVRGNKKQWVILGLFGERRKGVRQLPSVVESGLSHSFRAQVCRYRVFPNFKKIEA